MDELLYNQRVLNYLDVKNKDKKPIFTTNIYWPFQKCVIEAECVTTRSLTLLEKFILRSYNEISDTTAAEISEQLGLLEPMLIEETIENLRSSDSLDIIQVNTEEEDYSGVSSIQSSSPLKTWKDKINEGLMRLKNLRGKLTERGIQNLQRGKIDNPPEKKKFTLWRSLIGGSIYPQSNPINEKKMKKIEGDEELYYDLDEIDEKKVDYLNNDHVEKALKKSGELTGEIEIKSQRMMEDDDEDNDGVFGLEVNISLLLNKDGKGNWFVQAPKREELKDLEFEIESDRELMTEIIKLYSVSKQSLSITNFNNQLVPYQMLNQRLEKIKDKAKVIIRTDIPNNLIHNRSEWDEILDTFTGPIFLVNSRKRVTEKPFPFRKKIKERSLQPGIICSDKGCVSIRSIKIELNDKEFYLPTLVKDNLLYEKCTNLFSNQLDAVGEFNLNPNHITLINMVNYQLENANINEIPTKVKFIHDQARLMELDFKKPLGDKLLDIYKGKLSNKNSKEIESALRSISDIEKQFKMNLWFKLSYYWNQIVWSNSSKSKAITTWIKHQKESSLLAIEDAANLENHLFGHCNDTMFKIDKELEGAIKKISDRNGIGENTLYDMIEKLRKGKHISKGLARKLNAWRGERNKFTHEKNKMISIEEVEEYIRLGRQLIKKSDGFWGKAINMNWKSELNFDDYKKIVGKTSDAMKLMKNYRLSIHGDIWLMPLSKGYPRRVDGSYEQLLSLLMKLPRTSNGQSNEEFISEISGKMIERLNIDKKMVNTIITKGMPAEIEKLIKMFKSNGFDELEQKIIFKILDNVEKAQSGKEFIEQMELFKKFSDIMGQTNMNKMINKNISYDQFNCSMTELAQISKLNEIQLSKRAKNSLFSKVISKNFDKTRNADAVSAIKELRSSLVTLLKNDGWKNLCIKRDKWIADRLYAYLISFDNKNQKSNLRKLKKIKKASFLPNEMSNTNEAINRYVNEYEKL